MVMRFFGWFGIKDWVVVVSLLRVVLICGSNWCLLFVNVRLCGFCLNRGMFKCVFSVLICWLMVD